MQKPKPQSLAKVIDIINLPVDEAERLSADAKLGAIFREMLAGLASIERDHLKRKKRTAREVQKAALQSLGVIGMALRRAKNSRQSSIDADFLPWPLLTVAAELGDISKGYPSPLLSKDAKGTAARNYLIAYVHALAAETYTKLVEAGWTRDRAALEIAKPFQEAGARANGKEITAGTIKKWVEQSRKKQSPDTGVLLDLREMFRKHIGELYSVECVARAGSVEYVTNDEDAAEILLNSLRRFVAGTAFD